MSFSKCDDRTKECSDMVGKNEVAIFNTGHGISNEAKCLSDALSLVVPD